MVVEATLSNRDCSLVHEITKHVDVIEWIESDRIVGMNARRVPDEAGIRARDK